MMCLPALEHFLFAVFASPMLGTGPTCLILGTAAAPNSPLRPIRCGMRSRVETALEIRLALHGDLYDSKTPLRSA